MLWEEERYPRRLGGVVGEEKEDRRGWKWGKIADRGGRTIEVVEGKRETKRS